MADERTFQSELPALMQQILGSKTTTSQSSTANTLPLEQMFSKILGNQMDPAMYQQLIQGIFGNASQQIPQLTAALANSVGSRSSGNSALSLALNEQNNLAAAQAAQALMNYNQQQQRIAAEVAGNIANSTRSSTSTQTQGSGGNPLMPLAGGFLLNQFDKRGGMDWLERKAGDLFGFGDAGGGGGLSAMMPTIPGGYFSQNGYDVGVDMGVGGGGFGSGFADNFSNAFSGAGDFLSGAYDYGADFLGSVYDYGADLFGDIGSGLSDIGSSIGDFFGFANGGMVAPRANNWNAPFQSPVMPRMGGYANGGTVRNRNNFGAPIPRTGQAVIDSQSLQREMQQGSGLAGGAGGLNSNQLGNMMAQFSQMQQMGRGQGTNGPASRGSTPGGAVNNALGNPMGMDAAKAFGGAALGIATGPMAGLVGAMTGLPTSPIGLTKAMMGLANRESEANAAINAAADPIGAMTAAMGLNTAGNMSDAVAAANAISSVTGIDGITALGVVTDNFNSVGLGGGISGIGSIGGTRGNRGDMGGGTGISGGFGGGYGLSAGPGTGLGLGASPGAGMGLSNGDNGLGMRGEGGNRGGGFGGDGGPSNNDGGIGGDRGSGYGGGGRGSGSSGGDGGGGGGTGGSGGTGGTGDANGGLLRGPGTGTSDSMPAVSRVPGEAPTRFSNGEFIMSRDAVNFYGEDLLKRMLMQVHSPVRR